MHLVKNVNKYKVARLPPTTAVGTGILPILIFKEHTPDANKFARCADFKTFQTIFNIERDIVMAYQVGYYRITCKQGRRRVWCLISLLALSAMCSQVYASTKALNTILQLTALQDTDVTKLEVSAPIKRRIEPKTTHLYRTQLVAGQYFRAIVDKQGADVTVTLIAPSGQEIIKAKTNTEEQGVVPISLIADASGEYRITVSLNTKAVAGNYELRIEALRMPTQSDINQAYAERLYWDAEQLFSQPSQESRQKALQKFEQALPMFQVLGDLNFERFCFHMVGFIYHLSSELQKALECYERARILSIKLGDKSIESSLLINIGGVYDILGEPQKALEYYSQSLATSLELNNANLQGEALNNIGVIYYSLSETEKAIDYYNQALKLRIENGAPAKVAAILNNIANVYAIMGEQERALGYLKEALDLRQKAKDMRGEANTLYYIGYTYASLGDMTKALEYYNQALPLRRAVGDRRGEALTLKNIGVALNSRGELQQALTYLSQALDLQRTIKDRRSEALTLEHIGSVHTQSGDFVLANQFYNEALTASQAVGDKRIEATALKGMARVARERGDLDSSRKYIEESIAKIETVRGQVDIQMRASFTGVQHSAYEFYIDLLMRMHRVNPAQELDRAALQVSERSRARSLLESLSETSANIRQGIDVELLKRERTLSQQINAKAERLMQARGQQNAKDRVSALNKELYELEDQYAQTQAAIRKANPGYAAITQPQPLDVPAIQKELDENTLLLEYALGEERSYVWVVTNNSLTSYELPKQSEIKPVAQQVYEALTARTLVVNGETPPVRQARITKADAQFTEASTKLSAMLLAPLASQLGNKRLVIVADGALQYVPFGALPEMVGGGRWLVVGKKQNQPPATNHQPLILNHEIISLPSASVIGVMRKELAGRTVAPKMLAVIADPVFSSDDERAKISQNKLARTASVTTEARGIVHTEEKPAGDQKMSGGLKIPRLPYTHQEADQIFALAPKASSFRATDFKASRATVTDPELGKYRYLHFATHGLLDSEKPGLSSLVLSMLDEQGQPQDGFFRAHELYNLKLPAELVVLSACQTGLGKEIKGEGLVGLTRGFMYAGAARVIVSLWSVNDKATAELMTKLYQSMLQKGESPAAALRSAQVAMWKQKQWNAPYYWAAFTLQGEWR